MTTYKHFKEKGFIQLQKDLGKKNIHQVPRLDKVIVSIGIGSLATRKGQKDFSEFERNLALIT
jgi:ribosomal protein L5